jgi:hypothetical protein
MFRKLALAAAVAAFAVPAFAATQVTINVTGLDAKSAHAVIVQAAEKACRTELADQSGLAQFYTHAECVNAAVNEAEAKYASMRGLASR